MEQLLDVGIAFALGLLIGVERGWHERAAAEGERIAGIRTFGLLGLLGGLWGILSQLVGEVILGFAFLAVAVVVIVAHWQMSQIDKDRGITTIIAALLTFALGALAALGEIHIATVAAVAATILLSLKPSLHRWLRRIESEEIYAVLKLLLISVVLLPVLPDKGYGPWQVFNPYEVWWMVVLIAGLSFLGYVVMRVVGTKRGILITGLLGGFVSSTATTLNFARLARRTSMERILSVGVLIAAATMFPRLLVVVGIVNPQLIPSLLLPMFLMTLTAVGYGVWRWRRQGEENVPSEIALKNPLELSSALQFGLLLSVIIILAEAFRAWFGPTGIYVLAALSGLADVDAISLSLSRMALAELEPAVAAQGILIAVMVNTLVKGVLAAIFGNARMFRELVPGIILTLLVGVLSTVLL